MGTSDRVLVGVIVGAHGIRGEVKLKSFTADPQAIAAYSPLTTADGRALAIKKLRAQKDGFIAIFDGVTDRNAAEALKGAELFVARDRLPAPAEGEVYLHDLIGRAVQLKDGTPLGEVVGLENYGASDLVAVKIPGRKDTVLIPFADHFVVSVDDGVLRVDLPEDYLDAG
jgi:16S rRNA processing protein RimM